MDMRLFGYIEQHSPKFNTVVAGGLVAKQMQFVEQYIERIIRCAEPSFPPGFKFIRSIRCTPQEEFQVVTAKRNNRQTYELSRSDVYLMKYMFEFQGEELRPHYLLLPYVSPAGLIQIRGSLFGISPVLADHAVSVGVDSIFIPVNKDKLTFKRLVHHYYADGARETGHVVWSAVYHTSKRKRGASRKTIDARTSNVHYLFCKYGLTRTFAEFANADVRVGVDDINDENYPAADWVICTSLQLKPRGVRERFYQASPVRLAIRREHFNATTSGMIGAFFYIADHFPDRVFPEHVNDESLWKILLGHMIFAADESEGKILLKVDDHMQSLDSYIDGMVKEWLRDDSVFVDDIYGLFMHVIETFATRVTQAGSDVASMHGKRLTILRYILSDIISGIFNMTFAFQRNAKKGLTKVEIVNIMKGELKTELIYRINREHGEVASVSNPGDNMVYKITTNVVLQANSSGGTRARAKAATIDASKLCHSSIAEVGSYTNLPKSEPSGRQRINPFVRVSPDGSIERDPAKVELLDRIQRAIEPL